MDRSEGAPHRVAAHRPPMLAGHDVVGGDPALADAVRRFAGSHAGDAVLASLGPLGLLAGTAEAREHGRLAHEHPPSPRPADRGGDLLGEVELHPSWHWLLGHGVASGLAGAPWASTEPAAHLRRAAGFLAWSQVEPGHARPLSTTYASVPALRSAPDSALTREWEPRLASRVYDPGVGPAGAKAGALAGLGTTEKRGGSDLRATTTTATPDPGGGCHRLHGRTWVAPAAALHDVLLVLARAPSGLSCFVVPRVLADGSRNPLEVVRPEAGRGDRPRASAELELVGTRGRLLGEEGRGVRTIVEIVAATRLDCVLGSAALMRRAVSEAAWHVAHRSASGRRVADASLMQNVVADLAVESEAATVLAMRLAASLDAPDDAREAGLRRIGLPLARFGVGTRTPPVVAEALECLGGDGYVGDSGIPPLFRGSPVWEGSGNVDALTALRALTREPDALEAWVDEVGLARGADARLDRAVDDTLALLGELMADPAGAERLARRLAGRMAACLQGSLLVRGTAPEVADVFCASRLASSYGQTFGALDAGDLVAIVDRATPEPAGA